MLLHQLPYTVVIDMIGDKILEGERNQHVVLMKAKQKTPAILLPPSPFISAQLGLETKPHKQLRGCITICNKSNQMKTVINIKYQRKVALATIEYRAWLANKAPLKLG